MDMSFKIKKEEKSRKGMASKQKCKLLKFDNYVS